LSAGHSTIGRSKTTVVAEDLRVMGARSDPITFTDDSGVKVKRRSGYEDIPTSVQMTGSYVLGANELRIMKSLDEILKFLEKNYGLEV
jgi:hypothetical protein